MALSESYETKQEALCAMDTKAEHEPVRYSIRTAVVLSLTIMTITLLGRLYLPANTFGGSSDQIDQPLLASDQQLLSSKVHDFLKPGEADHIINVSRSRMERSHVQADDGVSISSQRTSTQTFLPFDHDKVTACILMRTIGFFQIPAEDIESLQVIRYLPGQEYQTHYDFMRNDEQLMASEWTRVKGQRIATMIIYLQEPIAGGNTTFPSLDLSVKAQKNEGLFWYNLNQEGVEDWRTNHRGDPVVEGEKWAMNLWPHKMTAPIAERIQKLTQQYKTGQAGISSTTEHHSVTTNEGNTSEQHGEL
ncbi:hypothetical protein BDF22DRAFT_678644 [Syncephalis plumigaleata]|nr:hypothetical protein BDF22DRAFT_678644 [Syncephalis plumigaleata]